MLSFSIAYKNKQRLKDDFGNEVMMFFNEDFLTEIMELCSKFTHSKYGRINEKLEPKKDNGGIFNIKKHIAFLSENFKFNVIDFIEYGQRRGKDWQYMNYLEYFINLPTIPKPKQKFINPKNRQRYVI